MERGRASSSSNRGSSSASGDGKGRKTSVLDTSQGDLFSFLVTGDEYHQRSKNQTGNQHQRKRSTKENSRNLRRMSTMPTFQITTPQQNMEPNPRLSPLSCIGRSLQKKYECKWCGSMFDTREDRKAHIARRHPYKLEWWSLKARKHWRSSPIVQGRTIALRIILLCSSKECSKFWNDCIFSAQGFHSYRFKVMHCSCQHCDGHTHNLSLLTV